MVRVQDSAYAGLGQKRLCLSPNLLSLLVSATFEINSPGRSYRVEANLMRVTMSLKSLLDVLDSGSTQEGGSVLETTSSSSQSSPCWCCAPLVTPEVFLDTPAGINTCFPQTLLRYTQITMPTPRLALMQSLASSGSSFSFRATINVLRGEGGEEIICGPLETLSLL
jgi:hypothetical protein